MDYFEQIGASLGLRQGTNETQIHFQKRIMFSLVSDWMQTAVFSGGHETSIVHVKQIGIEKARSIKEILPNAAPYAEQDLVEYIFNILVANGVFLHRNYYVRPAPHRLIGDSNYALVRGMLPEEQVYFSGLCPYTQQRTDICNIADSFALPETPLEKILDTLWSHSNPVPTNTHIDEYLDTNRKPKSAYYRPYVTDTSSMQYGRVRRRDFQYDYYLIVGNEIRRIPEDYIAVSFHEYARLYIMEQRQPQTVTATLDKNNLTRISFSFHLPQPDLRFLRYIAWPDSDAALDEAWDFSMQQELWPIAKERLKFLNYKVVEKHA